MNSIVAVYQVSLSTFSSFTPVETLNNSDTHRNVVKNYNQDTYFLRLVIHL